MANEEGEGRTLSRVEIKALGFIAFVVIAFGVGAVSSEEQKTTVWVPTSRVPALTIVGTDDVKATAVTRREARGKVTSEAALVGRLVLEDLRKDQPVPTDSVALASVCDLRDQEDGGPPITNEPLVDVAIVVPLTGPVPSTISAGDSVTLVRRDVGGLDPAVFLGAVAAETDAPPGRAIVYGSVLIESEDVGSFVGSAAWTLSAARPGC